MADFSLHGLAIRISHVMHLACHRSITLWHLHIAWRIFFKVSISTFFKTESLSAWHSSNHSIFFLMQFQSYWQKALRECQQRWQRDAMCQKWARLEFTASQVHGHCMCLKRHTVFSLQQNLFSLVCTRQPFFVNPTLSLRHFSESVRTEEIIPPLSKLRYWPATLITWSYIPQTAGELQAPGSWLFYSHCFGTYPRLKPLQVIRRLFK